MPALRVSIDRPFGKIWRIKRKAAGDMATCHLLAWIDLGGNGHFTVVQSLSDTKVVLADPTRGYLNLGPATWSRLWLKGPTGIFLYVSGKGS